MISHSVPVEPPNPTPLLAALALLLLPKEQLEALVSALTVAPMLVPYLRHLLPRDRGNEPR
ncbi:hypothetical protein OG301_39120 (plasmid) [Streptomyces platensis]|uniref:hypothetical protein n=1 Tax=Streptomyces platensis TaxID=58346 RepID=UPI002ED3A9AB|nr:hypothetical protein OG301_39120 [Streptomyces platensis]